MDINRTLTSDVIYRVKDLSFSYDGSKDAALNNVSLDINKGSVVIVCGPSGCGKTTLLRHLKPAVRPIGDHKGHIQFCDEDIMSVDERKQAENIGYIYQDPEAQIATDRVWTELAFGLESLGIKADLIRQKVADVASYFGMQDIYEKKVEELSGGEKQFLNLASVVVMNPSVIILDEPVSQLDPVSALEFISMLGRLNRELGVTIIISAHRLEELIPISTDIIVMSEGRVKGIYNKNPLGNNDYNSFVNECDDQIRQSLPAAARIYSLFFDKMRTDIESNKKEIMTCPFNTSDGRKWLKRELEMTTIGDHDRSYTSHKDETREKKSVAVSIKNIYFRYPGNNTDIIKNMSFSFYEGEVFGIAGANGSGKSTLLSLIAGIKKTDHGKISIASGKKLALLPQQPELLFGKNKVEEEIEYAISAAEKNRYDKEDIIKICSLEKILNKNPFSLSGGEKQRVAIAKILSCSPDIILMDEPSKGMDSINKKSLTKIIREFASCGCTIIIVSHDLEFLAECTDRCGMLFDGSVIAENNTHDFMLGNNYYTTAVTRITKGIIDDCVTIEDVAKYVDQQSEATNPGTADSLNIPDSDGTSDSTGASDDIDMPDGAGTSKSRVSQENLKKVEKNVKKIYNNNNTHRKKSVSNIFMWITYLIIMPLTVWGGVMVLHDQKYIFISLLIVIESMLPYIIGFEKKNHSSRTIVIVAVMCAIAVTSRVAFYMLPTFKPIVAVVVISGIALGGELGFMIGSLSMLISNIFFGQGAWTPWQMFALGLIGLISGLLFHRSRFNPNRTVISITGALLTVIIYGGIVNVSTLFIIRDEITPESLAAIYLAGLPVDLVLAGVTAVCLWFFVRPMVSKILRVSG